MTLQFNFPPKRIWLLWLLALTPICLLPLLTNDRSELSSSPLVLLRLLLVAVALALVNGVWTGEPSPKWVRMTKEFRLQLPGAVLAIFAPTFLASIPVKEVWLVAVFVYALGCCALGAASFGAEFEQRTLGTLLAQPLSRWVLMAEKATVLAVLLAIAFAQILFAFLPQTGPRLSLQNEPRGDMILLGLLSIPPLLAFCTGPGLALLTRRTLTAGALMVAVPPTLVLMGLTTCSAIFKLRYPDFPVPETPPGFSIFLLIGTPIYLLTGLAAGWWRLHSLQWRDSAAVAAAGHPFGAPIDRLLRFGFGEGANMALVRKELRLHVGAWLVAMITVALWVVWLGARKFGVEGPAQNGDVIVGVAIFLGGAILILTGAATIAEERELGTLDWQLTQPASLRRQWWIKIGVAFALAALLGIVLPAVLVRFGLGAEAAAKGTREFWVLMIVALGFFPAAIYASSLCRSTVNAAVVSLLVGAVVAGVTILPVNMLMRAADSTGTHDLSLAPMWTPIILWSALVTAVLIATAWMNLRRSALARAETARQFAAVVAGIIVLTVAMSGLAALSLMAQFEFQNTGEIDSRTPSASEVAAAASRRSGDTLEATRFDSVLAARYGLIGSHADAPLRAATWAAIGAVKWGHTGSSQLRRSGMSIVIGVGKVLRCFRWSD